MKPYDHDLATKGYEAEADAEAFELEIDTDIPNRKKTEERRLADLAARQTQGDRQDWRKHLQPPPEGYRLTNEKTLTQQQKAGRTKSIKAAVEKRRDRKLFSWNSDQGREWLARNRGTRPQPEKNRKGHLGGTYPSELYQHPYSKEEEALTHLCEEITLFLTDSNPAIAGGIAFSRACREVGYTQSPGTLTDLYKQHVLPHGEYQWV